MGRYARHADFFRVWTPDMAYVLGYWWADGCMRIHPRTTAHLIEIASVDLQHLLSIASTIGGKYALRKVTTGSACHNVVFCSKQMYSDLAALGGTPRKSRTIGFPDVPANMVPHFVRGVVDGDGTLSWNAGKPVLQVYSGSRQFLSTLAEATYWETGIPAPNLTANRDNAYIKWSTVRAQCLAAWLYVEHSGLALGRKAAVAEQFLQWRPKKQPQKGAITDEMRLNFSAYLPSQENRNA